MAQPLIGVVLVPGTGPAGKLHELIPNVRDLIEHVVERFRRNNGELHFGGGVGIAYGTAETARALGVPSDDVVDVLVFGVLLLRFAVAGWRAMGIPASLAHF